MSDVTYKVGIDFESHGSALSASTSQISKAHALAESMQSAFSGIGHSLATAAGGLADAFEGVVEKAAGVAATVGKVGIAAAIGATTYGVLHLNRELESTRIGLAAIFSAQGVTGDIQEGMGLGAEVMAKMRKDAAALPGEFKDLVGIFKDIAVPGFQAGAGVDRLRQVAAETMAVSAVLGLPMEQAGREMAMLLSGRAGAHNVLGMRLAGLAGDSAKHFNAMSAPERLASMEKELGKFAPAIDVFSHSFEGLSTTLLDNTKQFLSAATLPLFERIKDTLAGANDWFDRNHDKVLDIADTVGTKLVAAYDKAKEKIEEWYPAIEAFAENAGRRLEEIWDRFGSKIEKLADKGFSILGDPGTIDKIEDVLKLYAAVKLGHGAASILGDLVPSGAGGGAMSFISGMFGAGGGAGGAGSSGLMGLGGSFAEMMGSAGPAAGGILAVLAEALVEVAAGGVAAYGAFRDLTDETSEFHDTAIRLWNQITVHGQIAMEHLEDAWTRVEPLAERVAEIMGTHLLWALEKGAEAVDLMAEHLENLVTSAQSAAGAIAALAHHLLTIDEKPPPVDHEVDLTGMAARIGDASEIAQRMGKTRHSPLGAGGGGGGVHIDKVEITVSQNNEPNRVARVVKGALADFQRFKKASDAVPNYSAAR